MTKADRTTGEEVKSVIAPMSLRERAAQLFTFSAFAPELDDATRRLITDLKVGGIFLGTECLRRPEQVHRLTSAMQRASLREGSGIPLFISADFVAGAGCKLLEGATHFPKNRALGAVGDERLAYEAGKVTAVESLAMGVNFNYSPVVDINNNPRNPVIGTHSFGEEPGGVARLGCAVIKGYQEHGMIATAKHFPGHGDTHVDSHEDLPVLPFDRERLERFELYPFREAIAAGVDAVMVGHIAVPLLDPSLMPASLSYRVTTELLRRQLNFEGLIVTDGLSMKGITNQYSMEEACVRAIIAGADILLGTAADYEQAASMLEAVVDAVREGRIPACRIEESLERILRMKRKYRLERKATAAAYRPETFRTGAAERLNEELASKAATPLGGLRKGLLLETQADGNGRPRWLLLRDPHTGPFADELRAVLPGIEERTARGWDEMLGLLETVSPENGVIVAVSHNKPLEPAWLERLKRRLNGFDRAVWVHFGSEYDVRGAAVPCLLLYDRAPSLQRGAARFLSDGKPSQ